MENNDAMHPNNFFYKFRALDRNIGERVKCLLKGCHRFAKYSISLFKLDQEDGEDSKDYKQVVKFICSYHLENWDAIKASLLNDNDLNTKK